jgi:hypothetical protein
MTRPNSAQSAHWVNQPAARSHKLGSHTAHHQHRLLLGTLDRNEAHLRTANRLADCLGVVAVVLLVFAVRHHELGRHDAGVMTERLQAACHRVRAGARFQPHPAGRHTRHELHQPHCAQRLAQHRVAAHVDTVHAHDSLCRID